MATSLEWLNDHTLVIGDVVGTVVVKDLNTGQETRKWDAPDHLSVEDASISSLSFSRERHTIAAGHWGGDLTLYDPRADKPGKYLPGWLPSGISTVRWNPEGRYLAAGGPKGDVVCMGVEADKGFSLRLPNQKRPHKAYSTVRLLFSFWKGIVIDMTIRVWHGDLGILIFLLLGALVTTAWFICGHYQAAISLVARTGTPRPLRSRHK